MRNSIQIQAKKWSHILGLVVIIYATIGTILSVKFQVNLMAYTTPIIVGFCGMTVVFACTKRFLYKMLLQDGNILFFDKQKNDTPMVFGVYEPQNEPQNEPQCEPQNNENDTQDYEEGRQKGENVDRKGGQEILEGGQETLKGGQEKPKGGQEIQNDTQNDTQNDSQSDTQKAKNDTQEVKNDTQGSEIDTQEAKDDTKNSENDTKNDTKNSIYMNDTQEDMNNANNIHDTKNDTRNDTKKETGYSYLDKYVALQREVEEQNTKRKVLIMEAVREYVTYTVAPFLKKEEVLILLENINYMAIGQTNLYKGIRSDANNPLRSPDLRHLAWNIGERLGISNRERAIFIKASFPFELRDATVEYLEKNLRDVIPARIPIDKPAKGDYKFNTLKQSIAA